MSENTSQETRPCEHCGRDDNLKNEINKIVGEFEDSGTFSIESLIKLVNTSN